MSEAPSQLRPVRTGSLALGDLLGSGSDPTPITGVALDSRRVLPGDLYVALPGQVTHGAHFAHAAVEAGAAAVLTDPAGSALLADGL
ncbi:MAG: UDP-N-acetylmuramoyl-L-alanyl-D-glutamate--2,6-diaminopimelate ligase, partial [Propionibacteriaceae bacterium]|nr:UDP-N-acetylmuramoyl-L-alanyl-D-glutamate--2,6-diaminopimelate ligase [Propionibacteriaceae bacterium]